MANELTTQNNQLSTNQSNQKLVTLETETYTIYELPDGKFKKEMKYRQYFSRVAKTDHDKKELYKVLNSTDEDGLVQNMADMRNKEFHVEHFFTVPFQAFDEDTGENENMVNTILQTDIGYIATSSKSIYYDIFKLMDTFGYPDEVDYTPIKIKIIGVKGPNGTQNKLVLI